ncbi:hypothetical protein ACQPUZ_18455 [Clostridium tertium]
MSDIQKLKDENKKLLEKVTELENLLHNLAYYKEGDYAVEAVKRGKVIEEQEKEIQNLKSEIKKLKNQNKILKNNRVVSDKKIHNERGAGRKEKFSEQEKEMMKMYRIQGKTIKEIAEMYSCSVGLIHKIINE